MRNCIGTVYLDPVPKSIYAPFLTQLSLRNLLYISFFTCKTWWDEVLRSISCFEFTGLSFSRSLLVSKGSHLSRKMWDATSCSLAPVRSKSDVMGLGHGDFLYVFVEIMFSVFVLVSEGPGGFRKLWQAGRIRFRQFPSKSESSGKRVKRPSLHC